MPRVLTSSAELQDAQSAFKVNVEGLAHEAVETSIGYQGGSVDEEVVWVPSLGIWAYLGLPPGGKSEGGRFWNVFGVGLPGPSVNIVCEINPSRGGVNRRTKGAYVLDSGGLLLVCHRGKFTMAGGIPGEFFRERYQGAWIEADEGGRRSKFVRVAQLNSPEFGASIKDFVVQVAQIKKLARER